MIDLILITLLLIILVVASLTDIKTREIPDLISYGSIFLALAIRLIYSLQTSEYQYIIHGLIGFGAMLALGLILFYTGQWGGGDSKLLMGVGAFLGLPLTLHSSLVAFLLNLIIVGALYGFIISFFLIPKNKEAFKKAFKEQHKNLKAFRWLVILINFVLLVLIFFYNDFFLRLMFATLIILATFLLYVLIYTKAIEKSCMLKYVKTSELTIGDWIAKDVKIKNKIIAGPKDLGLTEKQLKLIQKSNIKSVQIKSGIPFVPSFLISYVLTLLIGNIFFILLF
jgi:Flp pilus assembly protein protease CpaA